MLRVLDQGSLFGERWGEGPVRVLALHGWRRTHDDFAGVVGPRSGPGAVGTLAPDLPGFGATTAPAVPWGSGEYAASVADMLERSHDLSAPVVVIGHSFGGRVAVTLAAQRPDLVGGLVLTGAPLIRLPGPAARPAAAYRSLRRLHRLHLIGDQRMERARRRYGSEDYRQASGVMRQVLVRLLAEDYTPALASLRCPVELVWGDDDTAAPLEVARTVASTIEAAPASVRLTVCPAAGHLTPLTVPGELRAAVDRLLAG